jgi:general secretion pathway protein B
MSYILDALRKAERERGIAQVPTLMTVHDTGAARPRKRVWIIAGTCLACAAVLIWFALSFLRSSGASPDHHISEVREEAKAEAVPESSPADTVSLPMPGHAANPEKGISHGTPIPSSTPPAEAPKPDLSANRPAVAQETRQHPEVSTPQPKNSAQPQAGVKSAPPAPPGATVPESSQSAAISLREAMAKMKISILMYDEAKSERMVFINNRKYLEGDYVDGRYLVESITLEGAVLSYQGDRALLRANAK